MQSVCFVSLIGFAAGILGTGTGGLISFLINKRGKRFMSFILEFTAGLMMAVVCFDLLPEAFGLGGLTWSIIGIILGVIVIIYFDDIIKYSKYQEKRYNMNNRLLRTGKLIALGIAVHNFPEGLAIGSGYDVSLKLGLVLTLTIAVHNIPEGLAMALPMRISGVPMSRILFYTFAAGVPMGIGAAVGALLGNIGDEIVCICLGFAGGAMLYIICGDLIPESKNIYKGRMSTIGNILGIILGIIISVEFH